MSIVALVAAALLADATASPQMANPASPGTAPAGRSAATQTATAKVDDPMICLSEPTLGSRLSVRTCMLKSRRDLMRQRGRETVQDLQTRSNGPFKKDPS